jgi:hypothetical protein
MSRGASSGNLHAERAFRCSQFAARHALFAVINKIVITIFYFAVVGVFMRLKFL